MKKLLCRRVLALLLTLFVAVSSFSVSGFGDTLLLGDINADQTIDASDALLVLQHSVDLIVLNEDEFDISDVDASGVIDATDALCILQYSVKLIDRFPAKDSLAYKEKLLADIGKDSPVPFSLVYCDDLNYKASVDGVDAPDLFDEPSASLLISDADEMKARFANAESSILSDYAAMCDDAFFEERAVLVFWQWIPSIDFHAAVDSLTLEGDTLTVDYTVRCGDISESHVTLVGYCFAVMEIDAQTAAEISEITVQVHNDYSTQEYDDVWAVGMDNYLS